MSQSSRGWFQILAAIVGLAAVYLVGNERVPLWDRDEPRYATASRHMAQSGDWVVPMFLDQPRTKKPILIYWLQAGSMKIAGEGAGAARLPSVIAALLSVVVLGVILRRVAEAAVARWATLVFASSAMVVASAKMCLTDAVLLLWILIAQLCVFAIGTGRAGWSVHVMLGIAIGLAGLTKGPVVLGVLATTLLVLLILRWWDRGHVEGALGLGRLQWSLQSALLKTVLVAALVATVLLPWILAMEQRIPGYTWDTLRSEVIERAGQAQEGHAGPPGYYLLTIWVTFFPWSLLLPGAILFAWQNRAQPLYRFALAAIVGPWLMMELIRTKLPHYLLPVFPFLAIVTAGMIVRALRGDSDDLYNRRFRGVLTFWAVAVMLAAVSVWLVPLGFELSTRLVVASIVVSIAGLIYAITVHRLFSQSQPGRALLAMGIGFLAWVALYFVLYLPAATFLHTSVRVANILIENGITAPGSVRMIDYKEPSLAFYQGGTIREEPHDQLLATGTPQDWPDYLVITRRIYNRSSEAAHSYFEIIGTVRGLNYAAGRIDEVLVLRKRPLATPDDP